MAASAALGGWVRVAAWNLERGRWPAEMAAVIASTGADVVLLSEVDVGMARSSNRDVTAELATALGMSSVFGIEFVELGLGSPAEIAALPADAVNERGWHGNAVLCRAPFVSSSEVRIETGGPWTQPGSTEPREGGRMAMVASVAVDGVPVTVASVHLESDSTADERAAQLEVVLAAIGDDGPAVVGGDLNTFGATFAELADLDVLRAMREADPARFAWPVPYEPLFAVAADHGFDVLDANLAGATTHHLGDGAPHHHPLHLDWLLVRGVEARRPTIVPAVDPSSGRRLSDHQLVAASVRLRR
jgi:endonuclease/exonuclease/phosphatase family metal-dependent hydrolase